MKLIPAEKLITEIDDIIEMVEEIWDNEQVTGVKKFRNLLYSKIISHQREQQQPEVDLDIEIDKFLYGAKFKRDYDGVHVPGVCMRDWKGKKYINRDVTPDDMRRYARHFYELGFNARKEE